MSFRSDAAELFGLSSAEADALRDELEEAEGFDVDTDSLYDNVWGPLASDYLEDVSGDISDYMDSFDMDLDDSFEWGRDDWVDAGEEYEITIEYEEH